MARASRARMSTPTTFFVAKRTARASTPGDIRTCGQASLAAVDQEGRSEAFLKLMKSSARRNNLRVFAFKVWTKQHNLPVRCVRDSVAWNCTSPDFLVSQVALLVLPIEPSLSRTRKLVGSLSNLHMLSRTQFVRQLANKKVNLTGASLK